MESTKKNQMEGITFFERDLANLFRAVITDSPFPPIGHFEGPKSLEPAFSPDGLLWFQKSFGEGLIHWLLAKSQRGIPPDFFNQAQKSGLGNPSLQPMAFSPKALESVIQAYHLCRSPSSSKHWEEKEGEQGKYLGDELIEVITGLWIQRQYPTSFPFFASKAKLSSLGVICLFTFQLSSALPEPTPWSEDLLVLLSPRLIQGWEDQLSWFHGQNPTIRTLEKLREIALVCDLFTSFFVFALESRRLKNLVGHLFRWVSRTLPTMMDSEVFSSDLDWNNTPVSERQALKRRSCLCFVLGTGMERAWRKWRRVGYLDEEYSRAQEMMALFENHAQGPWVAMIQNLKQHWSDEMAPGSPGIESQSHSGRVI